MVKVNNLEPMHKIGNVVIQNHLIGRRVRVDAFYKNCFVSVEKFKNERFILSAGCEITVLTPPENLKAMNQAAQL